jgi:hypothetical protein
MKSKDKKKLHERFLLDRFLARQAIIPIHMDGGESPDFLITLVGWGAHSRRLLACQNTFIASIHFWPDEGQADTHSYDRNLAPA